MKNIPNILSTIRILLLPFFVIQMMRGNTIGAGHILVASGLTDTLDGQLARRYNWVSDLGKILDPVADKLTQFAVSITLALQLREYWYFFAIMVGKDLIMLVLGGYLLKKGAQLQGSRWFGKVSTVVYYVAMILIVFFHAMPQWIVLALLSIATACAIIAALLYIPEFRQYKREAKIQK